MNGRHDAHQTTSKTQSWQLEPAGNPSSLTHGISISKSDNRSAAARWSTFRDATNVQTRTHNLFNEITAINGDPNAVTHDPAGNMTRMPPLTTNNSPLTCTYDPWNRLISVTSVTSVVKYTYDGDWKRIKKTLADSSTEYYYDDMQLVETRTNGVASEQFVYDTRYLHSVACRDILAPSGALLSRHYLLNDANFNVTSLISTNGAVVERYTYDPYGKEKSRELLKEGWSPRPMRRSMGIAYKQGDHRWTGYRQTRCLGKPIARRCA
jgi:YD repeat-containing protein